MAPGADGALIDLSQDTAAELNLTLNRDDQINKDNKGK
jgi:hypothetical protein